MFFSKKIRTSLDADFLFYLVFVFFVAIIIAVIIFIIVVVIVFVFFIIIGVDENGNARGSARSIDGFNIYDAISDCEDLLSQFGGHPKAAGMSLKADDIDEFRKRINEYALDHYPVMPAQAINIDIKMSPFYLNLELAKNLSVLEPFGEANPRALFALVGLTIISITAMGNGKHIRLK